MGEMEEEGKDQYLSSAMAAIQRYAEFTHASTCTQSEQERYLVPLVLQGLNRQASEG